MVFQKGLLSFIMLLAMSVFAFSAAGASIIEPLAQDIPASQFPPGNPPVQLPPVLRDRFANTGLSQQSAYSGYIRLIDDSEVMTIDVPREWDDVESGAWIINGREVGVFIAAAPDLNRFYNSSDEPGVFFGASRTLAGSTRVTNPALMLNPAIIQLLSDQKDQRQSRCRDAGRFDYQDNFYRGLYDVYLDCVQGNQGELVVATMPAHQGFLTLLRITVAGEADLDAATRIFESYQVLNSRLVNEHDS